MTTRTAPLPDVQHGNDYVAHDIDPIALVDVSGPVTAALDPHLLVVGSEEAVSLRALADASSSVGAFYALAARECAHLGSTAVISGSRREVWLTGRWSWQLERAAQRTLVVDLGAAGAHSGHTLVVLPRGPIDVEVRTATGHVRARVTH